MGLFSRFKRAVKANINDMISKAENPQKMLNQLIVDMNGQLIEAKKTVAAVLADAGTSVSAFARFEVGQN